MRQKTYTIVGLLACLFISCTVLAFGGGSGGSGHKSTAYKGGVDALGIHFGGKKTKQIQKQVVQISVLGVMTL